MRHARVLTLRFPSRAAAPTTPSTRKIKSLLSTRTLRLCHTSKTFEALTDSRDSRKDRVNLIGQMCEHRGRNGARSRALDYRELMQLSKRPDTHARSA